MFTVVNRTAAATHFSRRDCLRVGAIGFGGLTLPHLLRLQASAAAPSSGRRKSVIMIWLRGGPSHLDSYDMKPTAPVEIRGEFRPTATNVPGIEICDLMPRQAQIMDRLAIIRGIKSNDLGDHTPHYILTGSPDRGKRPAFGAIVSHLRPQSDGLPPYVSLMYQRPGLYDNEGPVYVGAAHRPFAPDGAGLDNLRPKRDLTFERLEDRRRLLGKLDALRRDADHSGAFAAVDAYSQQAIDMVTSARAREAFDLEREPRAARERYGEFGKNFLMARRLVEAGVSVVTLKVGDWDTHEHNFRDMRAQLPPLDQAFHALVTDLHDRGLDRDVAVVMWGEFGRAPRVSRIAGRDHWPEAGAAVVAGGGFRLGQTIGKTDAHAARSNGKPYTPSNILASLYQHLGIDPAQTIPDHDGRPMYLLDDREPIREL